MSYFPLCIDLSGQTVILIGNGEQIEEKAEILRPFGAKLVRKDRLTGEDLREHPAFVVVGDRKPEEAEQISRLCRDHGIPVNVVDVPRLCSFYFPALIERGALTVSISTGGSCPGAAGYMKRRIEEILPDRTEEILDWLCANRSRFKKQGILKKAIAAAFAGNRPLTEADICALTMSEPDL